MPLGWICFGVALDAMSVPPVHSHKHSELSAASSREDQCRKYIMWLEA